MAQIKGERFVVAQNPDGIEADSDVVPGKDETKLSTSTNFYRNCLKSQ